MTDPSLRRAGLPELMRLSGGRPEVVIGVVDGPVHTELPAFAAARLHQTTPPPQNPAAASAASTHATLVFSVLAAARNSPVTGICPGCSFVLTPLFTGAGAAAEATPEALAAALDATVRAGATIVNLSAALGPGPAPGLDALRAALDDAHSRGVIVVAAAGNQARLGHALITAHPAVLPVASCDSAGRPMPDTTLGRGIGQRGLSAPGETVAGLLPDGRVYPFGGTSAAAPLVTGTIALLCALLSRVDRQHLRWALTRARRPSARLVPPLLDAWAAYETLRRDRQSRAA